MADLTDAPDFDFHRDNHTYLVEGRKIVSNTQGLQLAGLIDYSGINPAVIDHAAWRGSLVHEGTVAIDDGTLGEYEIPAECEPYLEGYQQWKDDFQPVFDRDLTEHSMVANFKGIVYGMTADRVGVDCEEIPTVWELKATSSAHPVWGVQLAGYDGGLPKPEKYSRRRRIAVQLLPKAVRGKFYRLHPFDDVDDYQQFIHAHANVAWRIKHGLIKL